MCPCCATQELIAQDFHGQDVESCLSCNGLWFERGELNKALSAADNEDSNVKLENHYGDHLGGSDKHCQSCDNGLDKYHLMPGFEIEIDSCSECEGVWLDNHELEKVVHSPIIRKSLLELDKPINKKTWFFQILSQMPIEYNLKVKSTPWVVYSLLVLNFVIFASYFSGLVPEKFAYETFALFSDRVISGSQLWGLITHMYMHGGVMHIIGNMYFLWVIGDNLEDVLGKSRFLIIYTVCGFSAAAFQIIADPSSPIPMVGASGAIAGLFGMYLLWFRHASLTLMIIVYQKKVSPMVFFIIWLAMNIIGIVIAQQQGGGGGGVAYWAHIGGFVAGLIFGLALKKSLFANNPLLAVLNSKELKISR